MVDFGGWDMPVQYDGILAEHQRTRQHVSMFDTCHMDEFLVDGPGSLDFLSRMVTQNLRTLADGRCRYGFLLRDDGGVLDDLIVYRMAVDNWMVVVNAGTSPNDFKWMKSHLPKTGATLKDMRGTYVKLDVQGPESRAAMEKVLGYSLGEMGYFTFKNIVLDGALAVISRTGYTGEHGYEIYAPEADIAKLWDKLLESGVRPAGLGARDTLRLEAGLPLYGHELNETLSPFEAGMMRYAVKEEDFVGRAALLARQASGPARKLVGFTITGRQSARNGNRVLDMSGAEAGVVTSGSFAPSLGQAIGYAYVRPDFSAVGATFKIEVGSRQLDATVVTPPFYRKK